MFAAMDAASGKVVSLCQQRHRHQKWLKFLQLINVAIPVHLQIYLIADNYATQKHSKVRLCMERHPRFDATFTPASGSWLKMVERFFRDLSENRLRRGEFRRVLELIQALDDYVDHHNVATKPFVRTAKAQNVLVKMMRARAALNNRQAV